jgi:hypothetical protein
LKMRSTAKTIDGHHAFHSHNRDLEVRMTTNANTSDILASSTPLFQRVTYLVIKFENRTLTWLWNNFVKLGQENFFFLSSTSL